MYNTEEELATLRRADYYLQICIHDSLIPMGQIKKCVIYVFVWYLVPIVLKTKAHPLLLLCDGYILSSVIKMREKWEGSIEV